MNCIKCAREIPPDSKFCPYCGKPQVPAKKHRKRPNGAGSIVKLSGNRSKPWAAKKAGVLVGTFSTRGEAAKALERITDATINDRYNWTFTQVYEAWKPGHDLTVGDDGKKSTVTAYNACTELHNLKFRSLRKSDFQTVLDRLTVDGKSKSTCEKMLQLFAAMAEWAIQEDIMHTNYARYCKISAKQHEEGKVIPWEYILKIRSAKARASKIAMIIIASGCRPSDLFRAKTEDCEENYFVSGSKTKAGKNRTIVIEPIGLDAYHSILSAAREKGTEKLLGGYSGNKEYRNFARRDFSALMEEVGLTGYSPYDCRHTYSTYAKLAKVDPYLLARSVGHADPSTTDKYYIHLQSQEVYSMISEYDIFPRWKQICNTEKHT